MEINQLIYPMFVMVLLTFSVVVRLFFARRKAVAEGVVSAGRASGRDDDRRRHAAAPAQGGIGGRDVLESVGVQRRPEGRDRTPSPCDHEAGKRPQRCDPRRMYATKKFLSAPG